MNRAASIRFEVFTAVTMKNSVFWDGSCKDPWDVTPQGVISQKTPFFRVASVSANHGSLLFAP
jgi:hypothetical protein